MSSPDVTGPADRAQALPHIRLMKMRHPGTCACGVEVAAGQRAGWDRVRRVVVCVACASPQTAGATGGDGISPPADERALSVTPAPHVGEAGASLQLEYERRTAARESRIRTRHPRIGGLILALTDEPSSTTAFRVGAVGERRAAARLQDLCGPEVLFLLNRRLGMGRRDGDIDVVAVAPSGVFVIDVKRYPDKKVEVRSSGGLFSPVREQLFVGGRDRTTLLESVGRQRDAVGAALAGFPSGDTVRITALLCFVDALLPIFGTPTVAGVPLLGPKNTAKRLLAPGPLDGRTREALHAYLAERLPPA